MDLIAKNKVANYIQHHPETETHFATWLKGFKHWNGEPHIGSRPIQGPLVGTANLGTSNYLVKYKANLWLRTAYIMFLGTREEENAYHENEIQQYLANNPDKTIKRVTVTQIIKAPKTIVNDKELIPIAIMELLPNDDTEEKPNVETFKTQEEYKKALNRAIAIFDARPETDEFKELAALLPLINSYERNNIELPKFNALDAIKLRLKELNLSPEYLKGTIGSEEKVELFLSGKKLPSDRVIAEVYKRLGFRFPADRNDFIG